MSKKITILILFFLFFASFQSINADTGLVLSSIDVSDITENSATISWDTNFDSNSWVNYGKTADYGWLKTANNQSSLTEHSTTLDSLESNTKYYYKVSSRGYSPYNSTITETGEFTTANEVQSIVINNILENDITTDSANVTWETDQEATSMIWYGKEDTINGRNFMVKDLTFKTLHELKFINLQPDTIYYYKISVKDKEDKIVESESKSFRTEEEIKVIAISNVVIDMLTTDSATISWDTNFNSNTWVNYGETSNYELTKEVDDQSSVTKHKAVLNHLKPNTIYNYQVSSRDESSNDPSVTKIGKFTTKEEEIESVNISDVKIKNISDTSVIISWVTNVLSNTWVKYGKTSSYGSTKEVSNQSSVTKHSARLDYLKPNIKYYYQVSSRNEDTSQKGKKDGFFVINKENPDTNSNISFLNIDIPEKYMINGNVKILWNTSVPVPYYQVQWYEIDSSEEYWHSAGGDYYGPKTKHRVKLGDSGNWKLEQGLMYMVKVCNSLKIGGVPECSKEQKFTYLENSNVSSIQIADIEDKANYLNNNQLDKILIELQELRDLVREQNVKIKHLEKLKRDVQQLSETMESSINNFITYGVDNNTKKLGEGERAAVMYSYKTAFNKLPETEEELADAIKIANGRWPNITNNEAEKRAKKQFQKIYKRIADMNNSKDNAAVTVMAYGLRQKAENRNLESEKQGINIFKNIYGHHPSSTEDWNIMQAITYSGSSRGVDTDGDLLTDEREAELGTDPNNKDTDGDGYLDGEEVANGYNPLKK